MTIILGLLLRLTTFRFSKNHRINNTWQYRFLNTVAVNQIANGMTLNSYFIIYK